MSDKTTSNKKVLASKQKDISRWYTDLIQLAQVADYGPARGTMVIRPYGFAMWERVREEFDILIKELGVENAYFPLFIPMSLLQKEKDHVKGFTPELAVVTHGGGKKLEEPLAVRPTSETIMYEMYSKWISSYKDLPIKINQWNNVVRWEKRTYFFLRTLEFLWQEGHTAHATSEQAEKMTLDALDAYKRIYKELFAMEGIVGVKSEEEKFAGAVHTYAIELLMPDGKALQAATSHNLGQNFSKVFNITFQDADGENKNVWQTSWGLSTRSLGGLFLVHGDDDGLVLPPKIAPVKVAIVPILGKKDEPLLKYCEKIKQKLKSSDSQYKGRVQIMDDTEKSFGWRMNEAELKGIPLIFTIGTREMEERSVTIKFRLKSLGEIISKFDDLAERVEESLDKMQQQLYENSKKTLEENIRLAKDYKEFKQIMKTSRGFIKAGWCGKGGCEEKIKEETKATTRLKPFGQQQEEECVYCRQKGVVWYFAQSY